MTVSQWLLALLALQWEWLATMLALVFILLALGRYRLCWFFALVIAMVHAVEAFSQAAWLLLGVNLTYIGIAAFGLWRWGGHLPGLGVRRLTFPSRIHVVALLIAMTLLVGFWTDYYGLAVNAYSEALMLLSMLAFMVLLAGSYSECWLLLLISEAIALSLALEAGEQHNASLHCFYMSLSLAGIGIWTRKGVGAGTGVKYPV